MVKEFWESFLRKKEIKASMGEALLKIFPKKKKIKTLTKSIKEESWKNSIETNEIVKVKQISDFN